MFHSSDTGFRYPTVLEYGDSCYCRRYRTCRADARVMSLLAQSAGSDEFGAGELLGQARLSEFLLDELSRELKGNEGARFVEKSAWPFYL